MHKLLADVSLGKFSPVTDAYSKASADSGAPDAAIHNLEIFISNLIGLLTAMAGLFFIFYFVMGGLNWVTAGGEKGKIEKAREQMFQGVVGLVIIAISYSVVGLIGSFVGIDILHPGQQILKLNPLGGP